MSIDLINDDCLNAMATLDDGAVDLILTDPPYNLGLFMKGRGTALQTMRENFFATAGWDDLPFEQWCELMDSFCAEAHRVLKKGGAFVSFMAIIKVETFIQIAERHGFYYKTTGIWHKTNPMPRNMNYHYINSLEPWVYFVNDARTGTFNNDGAALHDFMECSVAPKSERAFGKHPTQKPLYLTDSFVKTLSNPGDVVLDPFMGSGGVGVSCLRHGRSFVGADVNKSYFDMARARIEHEECEKSA